MIADPIIHKPGIYFGLPASEYHSDPALGGGALKSLALDPYDWQYERLHGEDKDSAAIIWGRALHTRVLEGKQAFDDEFAIAPEKSDYEGLLVTYDDLKVHAVSMGLTPGRKKDDAIAAIRQFDTKTPIWDEIIARFEEEEKGLTIISKEIAAEIEQASSWMQVDPRLAQSMKDGQIIDGVSEVSIFYEDEGGVRLRIRIDRLLPHALLDLKSFRPPVGWSVNERVINRILGRVIAQNRYEFQSAAYIRGFHRARALFDAGLVFGGTDLDHAVLRAAMNAETLKWIWVLVKNTGAPQTFVRDFPINLNTFRSGMAEVEEAIARYRRLRDEFGEDVPWPPRHPADSFEDTDFPSYMGM